MEDYTFKKSEVYYGRAMQFSKRTVKIHILDIIEGMIVYKWFSFRRNSWQYGIERPWELRYKLEDL